MAEPTPADLDAILADAHLPTLLMCLVHLTGDASLLTDERRAVYDPELGPLLAREGGYSPAVQAELKARAKAAIEAQSRRRAAAAAAPARDGAADDGFHRRRADPGPLWPVPDGRTGPGRRRHQDAEVGGAGLEGGRRASCAP